MKGKKLEKVLEQAEERIKIEKIKQRIYQSHKGSSVLFAGIEKGYVASRFDRHKEGMVELERSWTTRYRGFDSISSKEASYVKEGDVWKCVSDTIGFKRNPFPEFGRPFEEGSVEDYVFRALLETSKEVFGK
jgi:hypothetical protein